MEKKLEDYMVSDGPGWQSGGFSTQKFLGFTHRILRRRYKYQPLDASKAEIRLLRLPPFKAREGLRRSVHHKLEATLLHIPLESCPRNTKPSPTGGVQTTILKKSLLMAYQSKSAGL